MSIALTILFRAVRRGLNRHPGLYSRLRFEFLGTSYAAAGRGVRTVLPVAEREGVASIVAEEPDRVPYFEALRHLVDADLLVVPGSSDAGYTASKIYPYILAKRPMLAIFHEGSSVVDVLSETRAGEVVTFGDKGVLEETILAAEEALTRLLLAPDASPQTNWAAFEPFTARAMTSRLAALFDAVVSAKSRT
jgi:hypothetical protein